MIDFKAFGEELVRTLRAHVARAVDPLKGEIAEVRRSVAELPAPPGPADIDAAVEKALGTVDQKRSADDALVRKIIDQAVAEVDERIKNGGSVAAALKSAKVDQPDFGPAEVERMVKEAVDQIPRPKDGTSVDTAVLAELVAKSVAQIVEALPKPPTTDELLAAAAPVIERAVGAIEVPKAQPGKDADVDAITTTVLDRVTKALEQIPVPRDGRDADPEAIAAAVRVEVERAVTALPQPQDGKSIDPTELAAEIAGAAKGIVEAVLAGIPTPKDGESVTVEQLTPVVKQLVDDAVGRIEKPQDGRSVTVDDLVPVVAEHVERAIAKALPPDDTEDLRDLADALIARFADAEHVG